MSAFEGLFWLWMVVGTGCFACSIAAQMFLEDSALIIRSAQGRAVIRASARSLSTESQYPVGRAAPGQKRAGKPITPKERPTAGNVVDLFGKKPAKENAAKKTASKPQRKSA